MHAASGPTRHLPTTPRLLARRVAGAAFLLVVIAALTACGPELGPIHKLVNLPGAQLPETSDPSVVENGGTYYVYGSDTHLRAPVTQITDLGRTYSLRDKNAVTSEAMPTKPAWTARARQTWAPSVAWIGNRWVMYFSADRPNPPQPDNPQCLGMATSSSPLGPFTPEPGPAHCGINGTGGALDPQFFHDPVTGQNWLLAAFGDTESPLHIMAVAQDGSLGPATTILGRQHPWEYHFIENPSMAYDPVRRNYLLTYSAGRWFEAGYSTGIARCARPTGPCTSDASGPWIASSAGRTGPGGLSFFTDRNGATQGIFSTFAAGAEGRSGGRSASILPLTLEPAVGLGDVVK